MRRVLYILGQLTDQDTDWLAAHGEKAVYAPGHLLIEAGRPTDFVFILLSGACTVTGPGGHTLAVVQSGDVLGEMSMIDATPPIASVRTNDRVEALRLRKTDLHAKLEGDDGFAARFYRAMCMFMSDRLRNTILAHGYGEGGAPKDDGLIEEDEIDGAVLDNLHLAGARFERLLQTLRG